MVSQMCRFGALFAALLLFGSSSSCADAYAIVSRVVRSSSAAGTYYDTTLCSTLPAYYRSSLSTTTTSTTASLLCLQAKTESAALEDELSTIPEQTPQQLPPLLDSDLIQAAQQPFSWDNVASSTTTSDDSDNDDDEDSGDISCWQNGQRWWVTREALVKLWILPEDVLGYYDDATIKVENKMLAQVPQLLRFEPEMVVTSATTVLHDLRLPPALLRKEPLLLVMDSERLRGGFETIRSRMTSTTTSTSTASTPLEACRETPGLLVAAATKWTKLDDSSGPVVEKDFLRSKKD
mmetsp:Transcript_37859/g.42666  ORF Transcript_37859/g.42666 Transcript_37859/m.42666 type:complete len:293 (-) Transcript_37859:76-954(-)